MATILWAVPLGMTFGADRPICEGCSHARLAAMRLELTRRGSYAIRAALTLARHEGDDVVPARRIAGDMHIPVRFLPQVLGYLSRAGIVEAEKGRSGGYRLGRPAARISLHDIILATEGGELQRRTCILTGRVCGETDRECDVHEDFSAAQTALVVRLQQTSLADVVARASRAEQESRADGAETVLDITLPSVEAEPAMVSGDSRA